MAGAAKANDTSVAAISLIGLTFPGSCRHGFSARWSRSRHRHPAVHGERLTDDVARPRTAQPQHSRGDLLGPARPTDRNALRDLGVRLLVPAHDIAGDLRVDQTG